MHRINKGVPHYTVTTCTDSNWTKTTIFTESISPGQTSGLAFGLFFCLNSHTDTHTAFTLIMAEEIQEVTDILQTTADTISL